MESFTTSDGLRLAYAVDDFTDPWRPADTLVLSHAAMGSSNRFYAWVPLLARHFRVVRMDMRGHGASAAPNAEQNAFERLTRDLIELLDHLGVESAHLAGSSAGGIISMGVAIRHPRRVKTLASYAATPGMKNSKKIDRSRWMANIRGKGMAGFLRDTIADRLPLDQVAPAFVDWFIDDSARTDVEAFLRFVPMMEQIDLVPDLGKIQCPVLVVVPGADPILSVDEYQLIRQQIPHCEFVVYDGMPHNITDTVPERCAGELREFLARHA
ncbi:MAG: alpha/beta fold hydrolase [Burkholderiales bacterium]